MQKKNLLTTLAASASALVLTVTFQNCSKSNFADSSSSSSVTTAAAAAADTTSSCSGLLCGISMDDINTIDFTGVVSSSKVGTYTLEVDTQVDSTNETLASTLSATISTKLTGVLPFASCTSAGTNVDFDALQTNLAGITFSSSENPNVAKFASAQLKILLKDGTSQTYVVDTATNSVSVSGLKTVDAGALVSQLEAIVLKSSCSVSIP